MKGKWETFSQVINGEKVYAAGRVIDTTKVVHSGNVELAGEYIPNQETIEILCEQLNF